MIDLFRTWLPQLIGYAQSLHDGTFAEAWVEGDRSKTSVYFSGELYVQVFGDLDADNMMTEVRSSLQTYPGLVDAVDTFLRSLKQLDDWIETNVDTDTWGQGDIIPTSVLGIFTSQEWSDANLAAIELVSPAEKAGFREHDFDITRSVQ